jgi:hypothetical protein
MLSSPVQLVNVAVLVFTLRYSLSLVLQVNRVTFFANLVRYEIEFLRAVDEH